MVTVELVGGQLVLADMTRFGQAAGAGVVEGVKAAAAEYAKDLAAHTPRRTGRAQESVVIRESQGGKVQTVRYDYKKSRAFYMRFVVLGAKPHNIAPKLRTARAIARARKARIRKLVKGGTSLANAMYEAHVYASGLTRKLAMTFEGKSGEQVFTRVVRHPGVQGTLIFSGRLKATSAQLAAVIKAKTDQKIATEMMKARQGARLAPIGGANVRG